MNLTIIEIVGLVASLLNSGFIVLYYGMRERISILENDVKNMSNVTEKLDQIKDDISEIKTEIALLKK